MVHVGALVLAEVTDVVPEEAADAVDEELVVVVAES